MAQGLVTLPNVYLHTSTNLEEPVSLIARIRVATEFINKTVIVPSLFLTPTAICLISTQNSFISVILQKKHPIKLKM